MRTVIALILLAFPLSSATAQCIGDCDSGGGVTVDEIVIMVSIGLGEAGVNSCLAGDASGDRQVTVDEVLSAVNNALQGCAGPTSICGGQVISAPRVCGLTIFPNPVSESGTITIQVGISDLEGDVTTACLGFAPVGVEPVVDCVSWPPAGGILNEVLQTPSSPVSTGPGIFTVAFQVQDSRGSVSNVATTTYEVVADDPEPVLLLYGGLGLSTYLGCLSCSEFDSESVFNHLGTYGSQFSSTSIWNNFSQFGNQVSDYSACNRFAANPPVIVDQFNNFYGRLTVNRFNAQIVRDPTLIDWLEQAVCN